MDSGWMEEQGGELLDAAARPWTWSWNHEITISRCSWRICTRRWKREIAVSSEIFEKFRLLVGEWGILGILNNFEIFLGKSVGPPFHYN